MAYISLSSGIICIICIFINRLICMVTFIKEFKENKQFILQKIFDLEIKKNCLSERIVELERKYKEIEKKFIELEENKNK